MRYRMLGKTGLQVSELGMGGGGLRCASDEYAVGMVNRALELGVNYLDTATCYGDSETKIGMAMKGRRDAAVIATKLDAVTAVEAEVELAESLKRLQTDHVDILSMHCMQSVEDIDRRMGPGGAFEYLLKARDQGLTRFLGVTGHRHDILAEALRRFDFDMVMFIFNIAEQDALQELIPLAIEKNVGMTVMKPVATGLLPPRLALRYLLSQPVSVVNPSATRLDWLEANLAVSDESAPLSEDEKAEIERLQKELYTVRCRICSRCEPCPQGIKIGSMLGTYRFYNDYRSMGRDTMMQYPWGIWARSRFPGEVAKNLAMVSKCDNCGECEPKCPYGLPIVKLLQEMLPGLEDLRQITSTW